MPIRRLLLASLLLVVPDWVGRADGGGPPDTTPDPALGKRIGVLIHQLGSNEFDKRESATQSLERIGVPALESLRRTASASSDAEVRGRAVGLVERIENGLDQLLLDYRSYDLPMPPEKALLVRVENHRMIVLPGGEAWALVQPGESTLVFLLEPATKDRRANLLQATVMFRAEAKDVRVLRDHQRVTAEDVKFDDNTWALSVAFAVQLHAQGWTPANDILKKGFYGNGGHSPRKAFRLLAWNYWNQQVLHESVERWPAASKQMKALLVAEPELDTPKHRAFVKSLEATVAPSKAKPGSVEALIDELIKVRVPHESDEHFARVLDLGFEAVPALLAHLDDDRLTRHRNLNETVGLGLGNQIESPHHYRVRDVVDGLLRAIAGSIESRDWPEDRDKVEATKRRARWDAARKQDEVAYLAAHSLPQFRKDNSDSSQWPEAAHVRLLRKKYPQQLAAVYKRILEERLDVVSYPFAEALAASSLPRVKKVELLAQAGANRNLQHRHAAFLQLKDLDHERFIVLLAATLDALPRIPTKPYGICPERLFASQVCATDDPRAWQALERAARRADPGLRLELLQHTSFQNPTPLQRRRWLALFAAFLDDIAVRDITENPKMFTQSFAASDAPRLEVRNFAALRIAQILEKAPINFRDWNAQDWPKLREEVRASVTRESTAVAKE